MDEKSSVADLEPFASWQVRARRHSLWPYGLALVGFVLAFSQLLIRLVQGTGIIDAIWPYAVRSLDWTMMMRGAMGWTFILFSFTVFCGFMFAKLRQDERYSRPINEIGLVVLGLICGFIVIHFAMDVFYLRGAFLILPTYYGCLLVTTLLAIGGLPRLRESSTTPVSKQRVFHLLGVFIAAWMIMPGVPALMGFAPTPPNPPTLGYGSTPGPYETVQFSSPYEMPSEVVSVQGNLEDDIEFSIYYTLPLFPEDTPIDSIPLAVLLHGFGYPDVNAYESWIQHLAAKGIAVAFVQYPSDIRPEGFEDHQVTEQQGMTDFLQHSYRDLAIHAAITHIDETLLGSSRLSQINETLGPIVVDPSTLWSGGHSLGGAYSFLVLDHVLPMGWGSNALVFAPESPAARPLQTELQPDLSLIPDETLVQIGITEDDLSVGLCPAAFHQALFNNLSEERTQVVLVQSDRYGFPRLVASHYLQSEPAHDSLADWGFYRRIDAQADYLVAHSRNDSITADWAFSYMMDETTLTHMGQWSDGMPVLPLKLYNDALSHERFQNCA